MDLNLTGTIPRLPPNLAHCELGDNRFTSVQEDLFDSMTKMTHLSLARNELTGSLPRLAENMKSFHARE